MKRADLTAGTDYLHHTSNGWRLGKYGERGTRVRILDTGKWRQSGTRWNDDRTKGVKDLSRFHVDGAIIHGALRRDEQWGHADQVVGVMLNNDGTLPEGAKAGLFSTRNLRAPWAEGREIVDRNLDAHARHAAAVGAADAERKARHAAVRAALPEDLAAGISVWTSAMADKTSPDGSVSVRLSTLETLVGLAFGPRDCADCDGDGWVPCEHCEDGTVVRDEPWESDHACTYCEGKGRQECVPCEGEGVRP